MQETTMAQPTGTTQTITATVEAVNERGIKVHGGWLNVSKYHAVALPMRGALVALEVKEGRWIQRCDVLDGDAPSINCTSVPSTRERTSPRLAVLKAAAAFAASWPDAKSTDVLTVADHWLRWVEEGGNGTPTI
jgi:hypothetical protein